MPNDRHRPGPRSGTGKVYGSNYMVREIHPRIPGLLVVDHEVLSQQDPRGAAIEPFNLSRWDAAGLPADFWPSHTGRMVAEPGSMRGAHGGPAKLVSIPTPGIQVLVMELDCRPDSPTYGQVWGDWADWTTSIFVPPGVANAMYVDPQNKWRGAYDITFNLTWLTQKDTIRVTLADPRFGQWLTPAMLEKARAARLWMTRDDPTQPGFEHRFVDLPADVLEPFRWKPSPG